jgi:hypothetical protein
MLIFKGLWNMAGNKQNKSDLQPYTQEVDL